ncbi:MAG: hypothetical protein J2O48_01775 [Solirubrobacterales bacterium]|nr:hypothetical protein [Solirubrobacterales bacterium]
MHVSDRETRTIAEDVANARAALLNGGPPEIAALCLGDEARATLEAIDPAGRQMLDRAEALGGSELRVTVELAIGHLAAALDGYNFDAEPLERVKFGQEVTEPLLTDQSGEGPGDGSFTLDDPRQAGKFRHWGII